MEEPFKLEGITIVINALKNMMPTASEVNGVLTEVANQIADNIRSQIPVGKTGNLKKSIRVIHYKANRLVVGAKYPEGAHIFLIEDGHKTRKGSSKNPDHVPTGKDMVEGRHIIKTTFGSLRESSMQNLRTEFEKMILNKGKTAGLV